MAGRIEGQRSRAPLVAVLLALSAVSGLAVAVLSGGGLGSGASPTWTPPDRRATPAHAAGQVTEPGQAAAPATVEATRGAEPPAAEAAQSKMAAAAPPLRPAPTDGKTPQAATLAAPLRTSVPSAQASEPSTRRPGGGAELLVAGPGREQPSTEASPPDLTPLPTPSATPTATPNPTAVPTAPPPRPPAANTQQPAPPVLLSPPELAQPADGASVSGEVIFGWLPTAPLPPNAAYEVVWWNPEQDPATAGGIAPPTVLTALQVNLDIMYEAHLFASSQAYWTVLVVRQNPYQRLTQPADSPRRLLVYQPKGTGGGESSPPPVPKP